MDFFQEHTNQKPQSEEVFSEGPLFFSFLENNIKQEGILLRFYILNLMFRKKKDQISGLRYPYLNKTTQLDFEVT